MSRIACASLLFLAALSLVAQDSAASRSAGIVELDSALTLLDKSGRITRAVSLEAVRANLEIATKDAGLDALAAESVPESRAARRATATKAIFAVAARMPMLLASLDDEDAAVRRAAATVLGRLRGSGAPALAALVPRLDDDDEGVRDSASWAISEIVPLESSFVAQLLPALASKDANVRQNVAWTFSRMGPNAAPAVEALVATLSDEREITRVNAALALGAIGREARPAFDVLMVATREKSAAVRASALTALRRIRESIGFEDPFTWESGTRLARVAISLLDDTEGNVREQAAWAIGGTANLGGVDPSMPALLRALPAANTGARKAILWAIGQIGVWTEDAAAPVAAALLDPVADNRVNASFALTKLGEKAVGIVPELIKALSDEDPRVRINVSALLREVGSKAKDAGPVLLRMLESGDPGVVLAAADALHAIDESSDVPIPKVIGILRGKDWQQRTSAAWTLEPYGPRARDAIPDLLAILKGDWRRDEGYAAVAALVAIDPDGAIGIPAICDFADKEGIEYGEYLASMLKSYGEKARPFGPRLARLMLATRRTELIETLVALKLEASDMLPALEATAAKGLKGDGSFPPGAFQRVDPTGKLAIPMLIRMLGHSDPATREIAARALVPFGPQAKDAVPALLESFKDVGEATEREWDAPMNRRAAILAALATIGPAGRAVVPAMIDRIKALPVGEHPAMLLPLARIDPDNRAIVEFIASHLPGGPEMEGFATRNGVALAVKFLGPKAASMAQAVAKTLKADAEDDSYQKLLQALSAIGPAASAARPALLAQLGSPKPWILNEARRALGEIGCPATAEQIAAFAETIRKSPGSPEAVMAANRLGLAGDGAKTALPALIGAIDQETRKLREAAIWATGMLGPAAADAVPALVRVLQKDGPRYTAESDLPSVERPSSMVDAALLALGRIGPAAKAALPSLAGLENAGIELPMRRIDPPPRNPIRIAIDPALVLPPPDSPWDVTPRPIPEREADGSFRVVVCSGDGFGGWCVTMFFARDEHGRPLVTADTSTWCDVSSGNHGPDAVESALLTLRSADWGSGMPIVGTIRLGEDAKAYGGDVLGFEMRDPFAAR